MARLVGVAAAVAVAGSVAACGGGASPSRLTWQERNLPVPAGSHAVVQSATWCGRRWYVAGATAGARGNTRPAMWASADGAQWRPVALHPGADYYAERAILTSLGCSRGHVAALGAKPGGAHGNPRVETWHQGGDGSLTAVRAPFEQYGGQDAVSVNRLSGGAAGYLVTGTRVSGAAVWSSPTGRRFILHARAPGLANTGSATTQALDAAWWHGSWTVVGDSSRSSGRLVGTVWSGTGAGPWTPAPLPGGTRLATAERVTVAQTGPVVAGLDDGAIGLWSEGPDGWSLATRFGALRPGATSPAFVSGLARTGGGFAVTWSDGAAFHLATGTASSLSDVPLPTPVDVRGDHTVTVAAHGEHLLLLTDSGRDAHAWLTGD